MRMHITKANSLLAVLVLLAMTFISHSYAQDEVESGDGDGFRDVFLTAQKALPKTLDEVRERVSELEKLDAKAATTRAPGRRGVDPLRWHLIARIERIQESVKESQGDRSEDVGELKSALTNYFVMDMLERVRELDEIKAKVAETEAKLQRRLDSQEEAVDLQLKIMLREADGFGFFPDQSNANRQRPQFGRGVGRNQLQPIYRPGPSVKGNPFGGGASASTPRVGR